MTNAANWSRIPIELRERKQWCIEAPCTCDTSFGKHAEFCNFKAPMSLSSDGKLFLAKSTDPTNWLAFETAAGYAAHYSLGIGYVISKDDPYCCIDFDVKDHTNEPDQSKWTHPDAYQWFWHLAQRWDSYTEVSRSGKGLHIWVRATLGKGIRKFPIEIYSQERFIICTGGVVIDRPIRERQEFVMDLAAQMGADLSEKVTDLIEVPPVFEDEAIYNIAREADNSYNFTELWAGRWQQFNHPSQSEADLALMSMLTFYSKSNEQCRRMFRMSALGQREKAQKDNRYLDLTLRIIRNRQAKEVKIDVNAMYLSQETAMRERRAQENATLHVPEHAHAVPQQPATQVSATLAAPMPASVAAASEGLAWPPGFVGHLAWFIFQNAPRPVKEVAIVAAVGLMAGICGKAWHFSGSGLNIYMILIARSAIGKEAMHSGVSALCKAASKRCPTILQFVDFSDFASGPALVKACAANPSFVNVTGEWGRKLKRLAKDEGNDAAMASLRTTMTNLYQKSGPQAIVGGITYSNKDSNIQAVSGVAYSMIGETTPKTFYEALNETMMEDGFLSRFTIVEYSGQRPELNSDPHKEPPEYLSEALGQLAQYANSRNSRLDGSIAVSTTQEASYITSAFEKECDKEINSSPDDESWRQMWNRASLKAMRLAALLAVGDNPQHPVVTVDHINWSIQLVRHDIGIMQHKIDSGDVGIDDSSRSRKMVDILRDYIRGNVPSGYKVDKAMQENQIVPQSYLTQRCGQLNVFKKHRLDANEAIKQTVRSLCESSYLMEVQKDKLSEIYNYHGKAYRVVKLPESNFRKSNG